MNGSMIEAGGTSRRGTSLRTRGLMVFGVIIVYSGLLSLYALNKKGELLDRFVALQDLHALEGTVRQTDLATFHGMAELFINLDSGDQASRERIRAHVADLKKRHQAFLRRFPDAGPNYAALTHTLDEIIRDPVPARLIVLRRQVDEARRELVRLADHMRQRQSELSEEYRQLGNRAALTSLMLGLIGVVVIGAMTGVFFTRLTSDLRILERQAGKIVSGDRGNPVRIERDDEVGQLAAAINHMAVELDARDQEIAIERQKYFHQEKMAAIGNLAAGIVHEIGNPIAAISGIVQDVRDNPDEPISEIQRNAFDLILEQAARLSAITRDVSEFGNPHAGERQLLDLNALVGTTCRLMRHDKRFRAIDVQLDLDPMLPAVTAVGDQMIQVLMNLLVNSADAMVGRESARVVIRTKVVGTFVLLEVEDNGQGMDQETLTHAFEAFFTTKPPGKGTGLGLSLCYSMISEHGGAIDLLSEPGKGTLARVTLPLMNEEP